MKPGEDATTDCARCGRTFTYEYRAGKGRSVCDDCRRRPRAVAEAPVRPYTCAGCGGDFEHRSAGQLPKRCAECRPAARKRAATKRDPDARRPSLLDELNERCAREEEARAVLRRVDVAPTVQVLREDAEWRWLLVDGIPARVRKTTAGLAA